VTQIEFADHHLFDKGDIEKIIQVYRNSAPGQTIVLTTEKDAMRLALHQEMLAVAGVPVFVLPARVQVLFDEGPEFNALIQQYLLNFTV